MNHQWKANVLWVSFKSRLGISDFSDMVYNLTYLLQGHDVEHLEEDFSIEDIHNVTKALPNCHSPGPDGFNGLFIKKCSHIIKDDFFRLFYDF